MSQLSNRAANNVKERNKHNINVDQTGNINPIPMKTVNLKPRKHILIIKRHTAYEDKYSLTARLRSQM